MTTKTTALVPVKAAAVSKAVDGTISYEDLLRALTAPDAPVTTIVPVVPKPVHLDEQARAAAAALVSTLETAVVPSVRRPLTTGEINSLIDERAVLDAVEKLIKDRKEAMRTTVFNHLDAGLDEGIETVRVIADIFERMPETFERMAKQAGLDPTEKPEVPEYPVDADAHFYLVPGKVGTADRSKVFVRGLRTEAPRLTAEGLKSIVGDDSIEHKDYLDMTTQVRVVDEQKVLLWLRSHPEKAPHLMGALTPGKTTAALTVGKA